MATKAVTATSKPCDLEDAEETRFQMICSCPIDVYADIFFHVAIRDVVDILYNYFSLRSTVFSYIIIISG